MENHPELHERITAGRLLTLAASHTSESLSSFGNWLLIGVGATFSLVLANLGALQSFVELASIRLGLIFLLVAIVLGVLQRWLAAITSANFAVSEKAAAIGASLDEQGIDLNFEVLFREIERGLYFPGKWLAQRGSKKVLAGDFAAAGRVSAAIAQVQGLLVIVQVLVSVAAIGVVAWGVKV